MSDPAPQAAAEADSGDGSRAANQAREEPVLTTPAHDKTPSTQTDGPDTPADSILADSEIAAVGASAQTQPDVDQADVPQEGAVTDVAAAQGTSESMRPVEGVHTPDVGPGGAQFDTGEPSVPGRTTDSR